jgi:hydrogenase maturation protein HypF
MKDLVRIPVQHHHAHIAACMAENRVTGPVIGVALDGTGYGTDGCIWGGEILITEYARFHRADHFRYVALPGGDAAIRHPWRTALAYARDAGITDLDGLPAEHAVIESMLERGINTVPCSSAGRLFDAASAMLGVCHHATYEGQAAIELEAIADPDETTRYPYDGLDFRDTLRHLHRDRATPAQAAARFHNTLANALAAVCHRLYRETGITQVALSGGTFQNHFLLNRLLPQLSPLQVLLHADVPANDAGISLGQALIANEQL